MCPRHYDKIIEYFCKNCTSTVCVKCMFDDHNGHELLQVDEMTNSLKQNVYDLQKMLVNATRLNEENRKLIEQVKDELSKLKQQQMQNIDKGFMELMKKLEDKKQEIMIEFEKRYKKEEQKFMTKTSLVDTNSEEIKGIEKIFNELLQFINNNPDAKILQKASDVTTFLHKSFTDLDIITKNQIAQKSEIYIHPSFKPLTLNVKKAIEIISKFEMLPPNAMPTSGVRSSSRLKGKSSKRDPPPGYPQTASEYEGEYVPGGYPQEGMPENMYTDGEVISTEEPEFPKATQSVRSNALKGPYPTIQNKSSRPKLSNSQRDPTDLENEDIDVRGRPMNKLKKIGGPYPIQSMIYAFGDNQEYLSYNIEEQKWEMTKYDNNSNYSGSLKYMSAASSPDGRIYLTGGCLISTGDPVNVCYEVNATKASKNQSKRKMMNRRYAHCSVFLNGYVYVIGGFNNKDAEDVSPNTINSCECLSPYENSWSEVCPIAQSRAFAAATAISNEFIYLFGGFQGFNILNTIEKYDCMADHWLTLHVKLPAASAKLGAVAINNDEILILGGLNLTLKKRQKTVIKLSISNKKWTSLNDMKIGKTFNCSAFYYDNYVYTVGGNEKDICERYDLENDIWESIPSYTDVTSLRDIQTWCMALI